MAFKTVTFTNEIEQRTHIQGEFTGKYYGTFNLKKSHSNFEFYDIHIYDGEINNLKNELDHSEIINETIYNALESETELAQRSFQNVLVNFDEAIEDFDSFRLQIKEPKLALVNISDVVKDGNQTFGTIDCIVTGYLSKSILEQNEIEVETCDNCGQFLEDCNCVDNKSSGIPILKDRKQIHEIEESFWHRNFGLFTKNNRNWRWDVFDNSSFGCIGLLGILMGVLFLISFGLPGILITIFILLLYWLNVIVTKRGWEWFLYLFLGLLFIGFLTYFTSGKQSSINTSQKKYPQETLKESKIESSTKPSTFETKPQTKKKNIIEKQNATYELNTKNIAKQDKFESQNKTVNDSLELVVKSNINETKDSSELFDASKKRKKIKKVTEIMTSIIFHEGEVFICKGKSSKRYHLKLNCPGLSNCSTRIYQINIPVAERLGRSLCKLED